MYAVLCGLDELFADNKAEFFKEEFGIEKIPSKPKQRHSALQIVTAYLTENGVVLGQEKVREKANEIPVFQEMFGYLKIKGKTITADAMHCQKETCKKIIEKEGNYVFGLKENQKSLYKDVELYFQSSNTNTDLETFTTTEKN